MSADVHLSVSVNGTGASKEELLQIFEKEIDNFSRWMERAPSTLQQGALTKPERIILMTYFMKKLSGELDKE